MTEYLLHQREGYKMGMRDDGLGIRLRIKVIVAMLWQIGLIGKCRAKT